MKVPRALNPDSRRLESILPVTVSAAPFAVWYALAAVSDAVSSAR